MGGTRGRGRRTGAVVLAASLAIIGCGGDGGDEEVALEDVEPVVELDPCTLLDADTAAELSGAEVEDAEQEVGDDGSISCQFAFADGGVADVAGSSIAASLSFSPGDEGDVPGGSLATALSIGDAGAVEEEDSKVRVVYVVETVVVKVEVAPADGEVTDELVDEVVEFAESTEAPVTEAVTGEAPADDTSTTEAPSTTLGATSTTADPEVVNLWRLTAVEHREQVGSRFQFECPGPYPEPDFIPNIWGTGVYTDDSSVCIAAVHAGVITLEDGGSVIIEMRPGQDAYEPSEANGITSQEWPEWPGSFAVVDG
jgi:hypothetical protein